MTGIYDAAAVYEVGFSYRDVPAEVDAILAIAARAGMATPRRVREFAAGPADHALEFARRGLQSSALDLSAAMCDRARSRAVEAGVELSVIEADMVTYDSGTEIDLAICLIDSLAYVPDLDALISHLAAVRRQLSRGGVYVVETAHPADIFGTDVHTTTEWSIERDGVEVTVQWGDRDADVTDPIRQSTRTRITFTVTTAEGTEQIREVMPQRWWTGTELEAAGRLAGMRVAATYGAFDLAVALDSDSAWRMITAYTLAE